MFFFLFYQPLQTILAAPEDEYDDDEEGEDRRSFYVLSGSQLNKWQVPAIGIEKVNIIVNWVLECTLLSWVLLFLDAMRYDILVWVLARKQ